MYIYVLFQNSHGCRTGTTPRRQVGPASQACHASNTTQLSQAEESKTQMATSQAEEPRIELPTDKDTSYTANIDTNNIDYNRSPPCASNNEDLKFLDQRSSRLANPEPGPESIEPRAGTSPVTSDYDLDEDREVYTTSYSEFVDDLIPSSQRVHSQCKLDFGDIFDDEDFTWPGDLFRMSCHIASFSLWQSWLYNNSWVSVEDFTWQGFKSVGDVRNWRLGICHSLYIGI